MHTLFGNTPRYCNRVPRVLLLSAVLLFIVTSVRGQDDGAPDPESDVVSIAHQKQAIASAPLPLSAMPEGTGKEIFKRACAPCHVGGSGMEIEATYLDRKEWTAIINQMVEFGAPLKKEEIPVMVDYLRGNFTIGFRADGLNRGRVLYPVPLPEGEAKQLIQRNCTVCHGLGNILSRNFDRKDWDEVVHGMVAWAHGQWDAPTTAEMHEKMPVLIDYLATNFKGEGRPAGVVVPGSVEATFKEWDFPIGGSRPHDTIYSPRTGFTWTTQVFAQALARFDPETEKFKEYPVDPDVDPYTLAEDKEGKIFFTEHEGGVISKLDPATGNVKEYPLPDRGLVVHDIAIDPKGIVWFAVSEPRLPLHPDGSKIGRLDPSTGEIRLSDTPTRFSSPYGLVINSKGIPWFTERGMNKLGSVNPDTMEIKEYVLPNPKIGTRRLTTTPDDVVWYSDYMRGYLGSFDPKTGKFKEWPSPSGPRSLPYGITHVGNIIWYSESESAPNMLVRFDPQTEKFQSWPIKTGYGIKHIFAQPDGNLWVTRLRGNGLTYVEIKKQ